MTYVGFYHVSQNYANCIANAKGSIAKYIKLSTNSYTKLCYLYFIHHFIFYEIHARIH